MIAPAGIHKPQIAASAVICNRTRTFLSFRTMSIIYSNGACLATFSECQGAKLFDGTLINWNCQSHFGLRELSTDNLQPQGGAWFTLVI
jgi:hypothetical protein